MWVFIVPTAKLPELEQHRASLFQTRQQSLQILLPPLLTGTRHADWPVVRSFS
jgi:hypothetical protein